MEPTWSKLFEVRYQFEAAARAETDQKVKGAYVKVTTVLEALRAAFGGDDYPGLDELWRAARAFLGRSVPATAVRANTKDPHEMEALYESLVKRLVGAGGELRDLYDMPNAVASVLVWLRNESDLPVPDSEAEALLDVERTARASLTTKVKQEDPAAIVRACFRACGYTRQLGKRGHTKASRTAAKKRTAKTKKK